MRSEKAIRYLKGLMEERYKVGKANPSLNEVIMPADAFECANTLRWVLNEPPEPSGMDETLSQAGLEVPDA